MTSFISFLWNMGQNPMFAGLVGASATGALLYLLRDIPRSIWNALLFFFTREITVRNDNIAFAWIERWLSKSSYARSGWCRVLKLSSHPSESIEHNEFETQIAPGYSHHLMWRNGFPVIVDHWRDTDKLNTLNMRGSEGIRFRICFGPRRIIEEIVAEAELLSKTISGRIPLYLWLGGWWERAPALRPRDPATVYLPGHAVENVLDDAMDFIASADWYRRIGVPFRRGYLFAGEPGTGKTTLAIALASHLRRPLYAISLANVSDLELAAATLSLPGDAILLLEDIDTVQPSAQREKAEISDVAEEPDSKPGAKLTLGGLLNSLDGVFAGEGRILVMTTNHPDKLDQALFREGRVDMRLDFGKADAGVIEQMFKGTFGYDSFPQAEFEAIKPCSQAHVQNVLLKHRNDPIGALEALQQ